MNNGLVAGIGDVLLRYPELIADLTPEIDQWFIDRLRRPYVALHLDASSPQKIPPNRESLLRALVVSGVNTVWLGIDPPPPSDIPPDKFHHLRCPVPKLRLQIEIVKQATKFIGTLSCFNVVAQLAKVPSFVLVNRSLKEPFIYSLMEQNGARVEAWNVGKPIERIYDEAVQWAR